MNEEVWVCERCDGEFLESAVEHLLDGVVVCSGCVSDEELKQLANEHEHLANCSRCGREATLSDREGWTFAEAEDGETVCPNCVTAEEHKATVRRLQEGVRKLREQGQMSEAEAAAALKALEADVVVWQQTDPLRALCDPDGSSGERG
jgi:DNA-directed RNA polymerase subunit RPC12/RpoP